MVLSRRDFGSLTSFKLPSQSMASLADAPNLVGFFSYSREDDEDSGGKLSKLREIIQAELRLQLGRTRRDFRLWQDKSAIAHGELWEDTIKKAVSESVFFIPIITPTAVRSSFCKFEFESFLAREKELERHNLIFPILYAPVPELTDDRWRQDPLLAIIGKRQYEEWQNLRHLDAASTEVALRVDKFCANIFRALQQSSLSLEKRQEAEARRIAEDERRRPEAEIKQPAIEEEGRGRAEAEPDRRDKDERQQADAQRQDEQATETAIKTAWDEYRGWSARARELQSSSQQWKKAAFISAAAAAVFGAAATQMAGDPAMGKTLVLCAAIAAALTPFFGKEIWMRIEAKWMRADTTAETIKSECFRLAARAGDYARPDSLDVFIQRRNELAMNAVEDGLTRKSVPVGGQDDRHRPPETLDASWYILTRIDEQIEYYSSKQVQHERSAKRLRNLAFGSSAAAVLFALAGLTNQQIFAPWIGAMTTIGAAFTAYSLIERREQLAATCGAMAISLRRIKQRARRTAFEELVTRTEDLLMSGHAAEHAA
jgi:SMODS and SLOG-associating 2TM effector domain 1/TIR domain/Protein of unknown function (DUF4231)